MIQLPPVQASATGFPDNPTWAIDEDRGTKCDALAENATSDLVGVVCQWNQSEAENYVGKPKQFVIDWDYDLHHDGDGSTEVIAQIIFWQITGPPSYLDNTFEDRLTSVGDTVVARHNKVIATTDGSHRFLDTSLEASPDGLQLRIQGNFDGSTATSYADLNIWETWVEVLQGRSFVGYTNG